MKVSAPQQILANIGWAAKYDNDAGTKYFTISEQDIYRDDLIKIAKQSLNSLKTRAILAQKMVENNSNKQTGTIPKKTSSLPVLGNWCPWSTVANVGGAPS